MKHLSCMAVAITALLLLAPAQTYAENQTYDLTVTADPNKANGSPWDGIPRLGNSTANLNAAPDIAVCVVRKNEKPDCVWRPQGRRLLSICQNQWTCRFPGIALGPLPVGLVLIDIDARNHDIIDTVILAGNEKGEADADIAESLRGAMSVLTPNRSEDSKERAVRNAKVVPLADCIGEKPCRLTQSELRFEPSK